MPKSPRYPIAQGLAASCAILKIDPNKVLRRAGLSPALAADPNASVGAEDYFRIWDALANEASPKEVVLHLAREAARIQIIPEIIAFSCSPDVDTGLQRLALYKPLIAPIKLETDRNSSGLTVRKIPSVPGLRVPPSIAAFDIVYLVELIRICTAKHVCPTKVLLPDASTGTEGVAEYLGCAPSVGTHISFTLSLEDTKLPLLSASASLWDAYEPKLREALTDIHPAGSVEARVGSILVEMIAGGTASIDAVSTKLGVSRRSLQRDLKNEGTSFSRILNSTRESLAKTYLSRQELSIDEVSFLLGFRDPNSFYRAFHGWTGQTPSEVRAVLLQTK